MVYILRNQQDEHQTEREKEGTLSVLGELRTKTWMSIERSVKQSIKQSMKWSVKGSVRRSIRRSINGP